MKVLTNWVIHYLADRMIACLDELNDAIAQQVEIINRRTPFAVRRAAAGLVRAV